MFDVKRALRGVMKELDLDVRNELRFGSASEVLQIIREATVQAEN